MASSSQLRSSIQTWLTLFITAQTGFKEVHLQLNRSLSLNVGLPE